MPKKKAVKAINCAIERELAQDLEQCGIMFANTFSLICIHAKACGVPRERIRQLCHEALTRAINRFEPAELFGEKLDKSDPSN
jgi:hypothetical protein